MCIRDRSFESRESPLVTGIYVARGLRRLVWESPEASCEVVWESREALTQLYCIRASRDSQTTSPEASGDLNAGRQGPLATLKWLCDSQTTSREASGDLNDDRERPLATLKRLRGRSFHRLIWCTNKLIDNCQFFLVKKVHIHILFFKTNSTTFVTQHVRCSWSPIS